MTETRMIDADVTEALDRWAAVKKDGGPEHQAASEALDDLLEELCIYRGLATNEYADARAWQHLMVRYADELERLGHPLPTSKDEDRGDDSEWQANVLGPSRVEQAQLQASAKKTREWLKREGFGIAARAVAPSPEQPTEAEHLCDACGWRRDQHPLNDVCEEFKASGCYESTHDDCPIDPEQPPEAR